MVDSVRDFENAARDRQSENDNPSSQVNRDSSVPDADGDGVTDPGYESPDRDNSDDDDGPSVNDFENRARDKQNEEEPTVEEFENRARDKQNEETFDVDDDGAGSTNSPPDFSGGGDTRRSNDARDTNLGDREEETTVGDFENRARDRLNDREGRGNPPVSQRGDDPRRTEENRERGRRFEDLESSPALAAQLGVREDVENIEQQFLDQNPEFRGREDEFSIDYNASTNRLSVRTTDEYRKRKRRELTQQVIDGTAADSPDDVVISESDGKLVASFSDMFRERQRAETRRDFAQRVLDETPADEYSDFRIIEQDGNLRAEFTDAFRADQRNDFRQRVIDETPADSPDDVVIEEVDGQLTARFSEEFQQSRQQARRETIDNIPGARQGLESEARQAEAQEVESIPGAEEGLEREFAEQIANDLGIAPDRVSVDYNGGDPEASVSPDDGGDSFQAAVSLDVAGVEIEYGSDPNEQFGDSQLRVNGRSTEDVLDDAAASYDQFVRGDLSTAARRYNPVTVASREVYEEIDPYVGGDGLVETADGTLRVEEATIGAIEGSAQLLNLPATARGLDEAGETIGYGLSQTVTGRGGEFGGQAVDTAISAGVAGYDAFTQQPARFTGMVAGTLATSVVGLGAANQVSGRAGRVARYAVQPGEELATEGANVLASRSAKASRFIDKLPGGRLDNEELVIAAGSRARSSLGRRIRRFRYDVAGEFGRRQGQTAQTFLRDSRGQAQIPRSRSVEAGEPDSYSPPPDLLDDSLTQAQDQLRSNARADLEARRAQVESGEVDPGGSSIPDEGSVQDRLTFNREERDRLRREFREDVERRRGGEPRRRSGATARSVEVEQQSVEWTRLRELDEAEVERARSSSFESESETEAQRARRLLEAGRPEVTTRGLLSTAEASSVEPARPRDRLAEITRTFERETGRIDTEIDVGFENEFETEVGTETELERFQEFETETEQRQETRSEFYQEFEFELETEAELELENEFEREAESMSTGGLDDYPVAGFGAFSDAEKRWRTSIADADRLLNDRLGGR